MGRLGVDRGLSRLALAIQIGQGGFQVQQRCLGLLRLGLGIQHRCAGLCDLVQIGQRQSALVSVQLVAARLHLAVLFFEVALIGCQNLDLLLDLNHLQALLIG